MDRLMELLGLTVGRTLLHQMGIDIGRSGFAFAREELKTDDDLLTVANSVWSRRGWGRITKIEVTGSDFRIYQIGVKDNPISRRFPGDEPMCHVLRGVCTGFLEAYVGKKSRFSKQTTCTALGEPDCTFEVTFDK